MQWLLRKIIGTKNERDLKALRPLMQKVNEIELSYQALTDVQLQAKTGAPLH